MRDTAGKLPLGFLLDLVGTGWGWLGLGDL
jgi:hypothetical protein